MLLILNDSEYFLFKMASFKRVNYFIDYIVIIFLRKQVLKLRLNLIYSIRDSRSLVKKDKES